MNFPTLESVSRPAPRDWRWTLGVVARVFLVIAFIRIVISTLLWFLPLIRPLLIASVVASGLALCPISMALAFKGTRRRAMAILEAAFVGGVISVVAHILVACIIADLINFAVLFELIVSIGWAPGFAAAAFVGAIRTNSTRWHQHHTGNTAPP